MIFSSISRSKSEKITFIFLNSNTVNFYNCRLIQIWNLKSVYNTIIFKYSQMANSVVKVGQLVLVSVLVLILFYFTSQKDPVLFQSILAKLAKLDSLDCVRTGKSTLITFRQSHYWFKRRKLVSDYHQFTQRLTWSFWDIERTFAESWRLGNRNFLRSCRIGNCGPCSVLVTKITNRSFLVTKTFNDSSTQLF